MNAPPKGLIYLPRLASCAESFAHTACAPAIEAASPAASALRKLSTAS